jgi:octaprenyl-diphosphate synthase
MSTVTEDLSGMDQTQRRLAALYHPVTQDLAASEVIYREELKSNIHFVQNLVDHAARFQGKRLRPTLLLLSAKACGGVRPIHRQLAAVVEMIHTASLVHDDILDEAAIRRHASTINMEWGNECAVLLGDYLFTHAFHLAASTGSTLACQWISKATNRVWEGEMTQNYHRGNLELDEPTYFDIIRGKTAELTAVSSGLGAQFAEVDASLVTSMESYGRNLGIAFQIVDDLLDIMGDERNTGKSLGTDLEKIKLTLPVIKYLATASVSDSQKVKELLTGEGPIKQRRHTLRELLVKSPVIDECWKCALDYSNDARHNLSALPESISKVILVSMAEDVVRRAY